MELTEEGEGMCGQDNDVGLGSLSDILRNQYVIAEVTILMPLKDMDMCSLFT